ncbi:MAG: DUF1622 domain-containing protein [Methanobacterium sp.]
MAFAIVGSIIIIYGGIRATINTIIGEVKRTNYYANVRIDFTKKIALGLEFFIAGDLIKTIIEPTFNEVIILVIIVSVRTIIGYTLSKESKELEESLPEK